MFGVQSCAKYVIIRSQSIWAAGGGGNYISHFPITPLFLLFSDGVLVLLMVIHASSLQNR